MYKVISIYLSVCLSIYLNSVLGLTACRLQVVVLYYHRSVRDDNEDRRLVTLLRQKGAAGCRGGGGMNGVK